MEKEKTMGQKKRANKKEQSIEVEMHQHKKLTKGNSVITFGFPHAINLSHKNPNTQKVHDETIKINRNFILRKTGYRRDFSNED